MGQRKITDSDGGSCCEGLSKIVPGGNGYHPHPPPIPHPPPTRPRTRGPKVVEPLPKEGQRGFRKIIGAGGEACPLSP